MEIIKEKLIKMVNCGHFNSGKPHMLLTKVIQDVMNDDIYNAVQDCHYAIKETNPIPGVMYTPHMEGINDDFRNLSKKLSYVFIDQMEQNTY